MVTDNFKMLAYAILLSVFMVGCGDGGGLNPKSSSDGDSGSQSSDTSSDGNGSGNGAPTTGAQTGVPTTIVTSYPITDAIENLGAGFYRRKGSAIVTDEDGNIVPDGTQVYLKIIDSIKATGIITTANGDGLSGTVLTDVTPFLADGVTATSFDSAYAYRNGAYRFIEPEDQVFLFNADGEDVARSVSSDVLAATTLNVTSDYLSTYPNSIYATGTSAYLVGASHIGAEVAGVDANGVLTTGIAATVDGIVNFVITYPANRDTLNVGCLGDPADDTRYMPTASAEVVLAAYVPETSAGILDNRFCFARVAGGTLVSGTSGISGTNTVALLFRDGGDTVPVPFAGISTLVSSSGPTVTTDGPYVTDENGYIVSTITVVGGVSDDTATVVYYVNNEPDITYEITVTIP